MFLESMFRIAV